MKANIVKRIICWMADLHEWNELTLIRWCTKCLWLEVKTPEGEWTPYLDDYDCDWMTPTQEKTISQELFRYVDSHALEG